MLPRLPQNLATAFSISSTHSSWLLGFLGMVQLMICWLMVLLVDDLLVEGLLVNDLSNLLSCK